MGHWFLDGSDSDVRLVLHINNLLKKYEDNDFDENDDDDGHHHRYRQRLSSEKISHDNVLHAFDRYSQVTFCIKGESLHIFS